jgi:GNAT superfamily N-acetyltransferase
MSSVTPSVSSVEFTVTQSDEDLQQILELQQANLTANITSEDVQTQGFVSAQHDLETLRIMHQEYPHIIAKTKDVEEVVGYALCMMRSAEERISILKGLFKEIDAARHQNRSLKDDWKYFVMGQVCVAKSHRGTGVFAALYEQMRRTMASHFDCIVTAISTRNKRSMRAHEKIGFLVIREYSSFGEDWKLVLWDWNDPKDQKRGWEKSSNSSK